MVFLRYQRVQHLLVRRLIVFQVQVHMMVHTILCQQHTMVIIILQEIHHQHITSIITQDQPQVGVCQQF